MKECRECQRFLPIGSFYVHSKMADGHLNKCKDCVKKRVAIHRETNLEEVRSYDRKRGMLPSRVALRKKVSANLTGAAIRKYQERYREKNPERLIAHTSLRNAVRDGRVIPHDHCANCGRRGHVEGHHDDYSQPLAVRWLCNSCHSSHHKAEREKKRQLDKAA